MRTGKLLPLLAGLLLAAVLPVSVRAQAVYGSISGTVTDASGGVVPQAAVTIRSVERNTTDTVETNDDGLYVKERLLPGVYEVTVEKTGYKKTVIQTVDVGVDRQTPVNVTLEAGQVAEEITVSAVAGEVLKTDRADVATTFEARQVTDLPILDRNYTKLILLTPGATQQQWQHAASENPQGSTQTLVNGQSFSGTGFQLDGTENRDPILGIIVINPNFEAVGETKITSQNYDAEFGQAIAGIATVQTKSGTNEFHGSLFEFRQNDVLQARNPFSQAVPNPITGKLVPDTLKNQFGGSIGGPIVKNKAFFFGDYQGTRSKVGGSKLLTVPTAAARTGDFSAYGRPIFDPLTGLRFADPSRATAANPGGLDIIPASRISQQARNILALVPLPNIGGSPDNGTRDNFATGGSELFDNDTFDVRIDHRLTDALNYFGRYSFADFTRGGPTAFGAGGGPELVTLGGTSKVRNQSLALGFDYTLNPTTLLDVRFGAFKYKVNVLPFDFGTSPSTSAGIPGLNFDDFSSGLSEFEIQGDRGFKAGSGLNTNRCNCPLDQEEKQYQIVGNLTKIFGNHTAKFGIDVRRAINLRVPSDEHRSGSLRFSDNRTANRANPSGTGLGTATFLIGDVTSFGRYVSTSTDAGERQWRHFYYAQDTWRVTPKLTIAYGARADVINPQSASGPAAAGFPNLDTGEVLVAGVGDIPLNGGVENKWNFAPRLGVSYQLSPKTVIRAGYGRSYDLGVFGSVFGHTVTQNLPVLATQQLNSAQFERVFTLAQGPPAFTNFFGLNRPPNQGGTPNASLPTNGRFFLPDGVRPRAVNFKQRLPQVDAYNITVQHELRRNLTLEVAFVGNKGTHLFSGNNPDENVNQPQLAGFGTLSRDQRKPFFRKFGWTQDILLYCNCSDNNYQALQTKIEKRFSNGYQLLAHYTLQRARDYSDDRYIPDAPPDYGYGPEDFIRTHNFVLSQVAELPFGRGKRYFGNVGRGLNYLVGGWQFNSNTMIQSGLPFDVGFDNAGINDVGDNRPNVNGTVTINGGRDRYFDPTVFSAPAVGTLGNMKRNSLRGPGYWRTDASLFKKFLFSESKELEFRIEAVNLFNHVNLENPDTNIGNPASPNANAGRISSTAFFGVDPQRNFQFALKFKF